VSDPGGRRLARSGHQAAAANPELAAELERVRSEKEAALEAGEFELAAGLREQERLFRRQLLGLQPEPWQAPPEAPPTRRTDVLKLCRSPGSRLRSGGMPQGSVSYAVGLGVAPLFLGWLLFGVALGIGVLISWLIWG
jgi:hypothetical protein